VQVTPGEARAAAGRLERPEPLGAAIQEAVRQEQRQRQTAQSGGHGERRPVSAQ